MLLLISHFIRPLEVLMKVPHQVGKMMAISTIAFILSSVFSSPVSAGYIAELKGSDPAYTLDQTVVGKAGGVGFVGNWVGSTSATSGVIKNSVLGQSFAMTGSTAYVRSLERELRAGDHLTVLFAPPVQTSLQTTWVGLSEGAGSTTRTGAASVLAEGSNLKLQSGSGKQTLAALDGNPYSIRFTMITDGQFRLDVTNMGTGALITRTADLAAFANQIEFGGASSPGTAYANNWGVNVPEPTSAALIGIGALGLLARRRRRQ
ncbi:MAG: PEP-CTERM sorting domain-containing protein [Patescibacteria group bacterium]